MKGFKRLKVVTKPALLIFFSSYSLGVGNLESEAMLLAIFNFLKRAIFNWVLQRLVLTCPRLQNVQMPLNVQWLYNFLSLHVIVGKENLLVEMM